MIYYFIVNCILYSADVSPSVCFFVWSTQIAFELLKFFFYPKRPFYIAFIYFFFFYLYTLFLYYLSLLLTGRISVFLYICAIYGQVAIVFFLKSLSLFSCFMVLFALLFAIGVYMHRNKGSRKKVFFFSGPATKASPSS